MSGRSATVDRVVRGQLCAGCGLCASLSNGAISMEFVPPGYARPTQVGRLPDGAELRIAATCPGAVVARWDQTGMVHPYWGPYLSISTGHAQDNQIRYEGSSGGALTALLIHALQSRQIDRVIHVCADPANPTRNITTCSTTAQEILAGAGSRYTASSPLDQIDAALSDGGAFAFVGKPCDVSALRRLAALDARVTQHVPLVFSFFCGGMPSHAGVERIVGAMGLSVREIAAFRYRGRGWPGRTVATTADGRVGEMTYAESWGAHLSKEVQFRCKICPDAVGGVADIACADAWYGGESGYPTFEEKDGRSLIIARTNAGQRLIESAQAAAAIKIEVLDVDQIDLMQPSQARRKRLVVPRTAALVALGQPAPKMAGTELAAAFRRAGVGETLRNFLGTLRRVATGRR